MKAACYGTLRARGRCSSTLAGRRGRASLPEAVQKALRDALMRGTWRADKARLYVSNSPRRDTGSAYTVTQQGKLLSLDPDPYFSNADVPSKATYERLR